MNEVRALLASALAPLSGFASTATGLVAGFAMDAEEEANHNSYLRHEWGRIVRPEEYAAKRGDLQMLIGLARVEADRYKHRNKHGGWLPALLGPKLVANSRAIPELILGYDSLVFSCLIERGELGLLRWASALPKSGTSGAVAITNSAARYGQLLILRWARALHIYWCDEIYPLAARGGHLDVLRWARAHGCPQTEATAIAVYTAAAEEGHQDVLEWARGEGFEWGPEVCAAAARRGRLAVLQWLRAEGCPWDDSTSAAAVDEGHLSILRWAHAEGCPLDPDACDSAAAAGRLDVLQWVRTKGCEWSGNTCARAAERGHLGALQWLRAEGCPWDDSTTAAAISGGHLSVLQWALAHGCPPSSCNGIDPHGLDGFQLARAVHLCGCSRAADEPDACHNTLKGVVSCFVLRQALHWVGFQWDDDPLVKGLALPSSVEEWDGLEARMEAYAAAHASPA